MLTCIVAVIGPDAVLIWVEALNVSGAPPLPEVCATPVAADKTAKPIIIIMEETRTEASLWALLENCLHERLQLLDRRAVFERRDVRPDLAGGHDLLQQAAHDRAARGLGQHIGEDHVLRYRDLADALGHSRTYGLLGFR